MMNAWILKFFLCIGFVILNFYSIFILPKKIDGKKFMRRGLLLFALISLGGIAISFLFYKVDVSESPFILIHTLNIITISIALAHRYYHFVIDRVINLHLTHNQKNIHRHPIKFLIEKQDTLKKVITILHFIASLMMLYAACFEKY